jgi:hypothetical protein
MVPFLGSTKFNEQKGGTALGLSHVRPLGNLPDHHFLIPFSADQSFSRELRSSAS